MKLSECSFGLIVRSKEHFMVGIIKGISENCYGEPVLMVEFQNGRKIPCESSNLELYED